MVMKRGSRSLGRIMVLESRGVACDPLVVLTAQDGADETDRCLVVGEDADDVGR
jgi:hypothetical protein